MGIRNKVYFLLDRLKGSPIQKNLKDIDRIIKSQDNNLELKSILTYAQKNIPYYAEIKDADLALFPVMNKTTINQNFDKIFNNNYDKSKLHSTATSGSTGIPFITYQDGGKRNRTIADLIYMFNSFGFYTGDRYVFLRSWTKHYNSSLLKRIKQNFIAIDVNNFFDDEKEKLHSLLKKDKKIVALIGYASSFEEYINYLERKNIGGGEYSLKVVITASDELKASVKERGRKIFNCPIINRYSNEECGVLGWSGENDDIFHLNIASYHFELLRFDCDEPVKAGEIGRIVVTDLFNKAMSLIRYDLGDLGVSAEDGANVKTLTKLLGRTADTIYSDEGLLISAVTLSSYLAEYKKIKKYQVILTHDNNLEVLIVSDEEDLSELKELFVKLFGNKRQILIKKVDDIPNEKNGKFKTIKNNYRV